MSSRWVAAAVLGALAVSVASADLPLPAGYKYVDPIVQFAGVEKYKDQVFVLRFLTFTGGPAGIPPEIRVVKDAEPFALNAQRRLANMYLFAVERKTYDKNKDNPGKDWLSEDTAGVLEASVEAPSTIGKANEDVPVTRYRVEISKGKLKVERDIAKKKQGESSSVMPPWVIGLGLALCMTAVGQWFVRRRGMRPGA